MCDNEIVWADIFRQHFHLAGLGIDDNDFSGLGSTGVQFAVWAKLHSTDAGGTFEVKMHLARGGDL